LVKCSHTGKSRGKIYTHYMGVAMLPKDEKRIFVVAKLAAVMILLASACSSNIRGDNSETPEAPNNSTLNYIEVPGDGLGDSNGGGGAAIAYINDGDRPDLVFMGVDDPDEENSFRYKIGWDLDSSGQAGSWSDFIQVDGLGWHNAGGGAAIADIDGNGRPDLVLMGVDFPAGLNNFRYTIGWNLDKSGRAERWTSPMIQVDGLGQYEIGGGAAIADLNSNSMQDLLLVGYDYNRVYGNPLLQPWYRIGWDLDKNGNASWSEVKKGKTLECEWMYYPYEILKTGGGAEIVDIDGNGRPDLLLLVIYLPKGYSEPQLTYQVGWDLDKDGNVRSWTDYVRMGNVGWHTAGGGLAAGYIDNNSEPDAIYMGIDDSPGANHFRYVIEWDLRSKLKP